MSKNGAFFTLFGLVTDDHAQNRNLSKLHAVM